MSAEPTLRTSAATADPSAAPVRESQRIDALDVLRGFAVLGILTMNIGGFSMPEATYFDPTAWGSLTGANGWVWRITHLLADLKFMAIFSMLFGAGIVLMSDRQKAKGRSATGLHYKRMFWLLLFGLAHAHLIWYGDVLVWYAVVGSIVFFMRNRRPRTLLLAGATMLLLGWGIMGSVSLSWSSWPEADQTELIAELKPPMEVKEAQVETYRSGWLAQLPSRSASATSMETETLALWAFWRVSGLMMLGMGLFKLGVFSATASRRTYLTLLGLAAVVGLPLVAYGIRWQFANEWVAPGFFFTGGLFNYAGSPFVALGWVSVVMLIIQSGAVRWLTDRLAATGRMAFTNYIAQSVICTFIFYGHGLGLFGSVDRVGQAAIVLAVWAVQLAWSPWWLNRFHYGPLEWMWRSLVYGKAQRFQRGIA
ncbi:MAG: DUF418 domain-containing protein [Gemmatimonadota bacterium]